MSIANVGSVDRIFRLVVGAALLASPFFLHLDPQSIPAIAAYAVGVILIATAIFSFCPLYALLRIRTCKKKPN